MSDDRIDLWVAYPDDLKDKAMARACAGLLSEDERARWSRFRFERHRREYLATRTLQRMALSFCTAVAPESWRFEIGAHGKPAAGQAPGIEFNLSNSLGLVVCAVSRGAELGVDVEPHARAATIQEVAEKFFSARELEQFHALAGEARRQRGLALWTLKEAYMKALGLGMALPTKRFSFVFEEAGKVRLEADKMRPEAGAETQRPARHWRFCALDHAAHRIALVVEGDRAPQLSMWEARPMLSRAAVPIDPGEVRWHFEPGD